MTLLAIDTSTEQASVSLLKDQVYYNLEQAARNQHAQCILSMIDKLLKQTHTKVSQLKAIAFGCGPGSFTGLRIACSVAQGLAYAHDLPLYPVSTLAAIALKVFQSTEGNSESVLTILDARMQEVYWGVYDRTFNKVEEKVSAMKDIPLSEEKSYIMAGLGYQQYWTQFTKQSQITQQLEIYPHAEYMLRLITAGYAHPQNLAEALPIYIRNQVVQGAAHG
jgi:tRNA threonylcarbamoyladenosine biosynthesis protein TsaB